MWDGIPDSVKANIDKMMNLTIKDLEDVKLRRRLKLKPSGRRDIESLLTKIIEDPCLLYDTVEFHPGSLGCFYYKDYIVFYGLNNLYPCVKVNNKLHLINLSPN